MNLQEDRCLLKKIKVNTLADRSEVDVSCNVEKLNDPTKTE